jgi:hypothetical protein
MILHQIDVNEPITKEAAKTLAQILISAQGIETPVMVKVVLPSAEHIVYLD